jgi:hypothetical protein
MPTFSGTQPECKTNTSYIMLSFKNERKEGFMFVHIYDLLLQEFYALCHKSENENLLAIIK